MASLPSQHPTLSIHLSDRNLNPILTSARSETQLDALTSLTSTSLTAHAAAQRLALGHPQRLIVEHGPGNPVVLTSYLDPAALSPPSGPLHPSSPSRPSTPHHSTAPAVAVAVAVPAPDSIPSGSPAAATPPVEELAATSLSGPEGGSDSRASGTTSPKARSQNTRETSPPTTATATATAATGTKIPPSKRSAPESDDEARNTATKAPILVGLVVAGTAEEALEARRAAIRLERVGRAVQREWLEEEEQKGDSDTDKSAASQPL
ncbi:hypothetical protein SODALDRAFT_331287 [Sodiomyces alkalinus F11]|uniref:Uncharacterized protein n=1 Tax=Sodiomyces alkalinus (strain CBS 110278 / VKM F-3762 / F11) TaxID=1314773 RepID=A0A3N2Q457_SODAK|nr:hypothetical protein SODALDRAFT_331287 [Sodiomyces alkalinus F11]ROT41540.1 hypothetical protein SODALDRAFT_331287 [Sodiomyces alkalinus F11]